MTGEKGQGSDEEEPTIKSTVKARVLASIVVENKTYKPNDIIETTAATMKALGAAVDLSPSAVSYCTTHKETP